MSVRLKCTLLLASLLVFASASCDDEGDPPADLAGGDGTGSDDRDQRSDTTPTVPGNEPCRETAQQDADGDGLLNGEEDLDLDCEVDPGETDWQNADSDGDGLNDRDERLDPRFDPLNPDSDGNGVLDGAEPLAAVCRESLVPQVSVGGVTNLGVALAAAVDDFDLAARGEGVASFELDARLFGYVVRRATRNGSVAVENGLALLDIAQGGFSVAVEFQDQPFLTWEARHSDPERDLPAMPAIRSQVDLGPHSQSLDAVRDGIAERLVGAPLSALANPPAAPRCDATPDDEVVLWQSTIQGADDVTTVVGAVTCRSFLDGDPQTRFSLDDLTNTTMLAPARNPRSFTPQGIRCEQVEALAEPTDVDFLWVVDTSGSMADEQAAVAAAAELFFDTMVRSGSQWRLGVTTTETWALDRPVQGANLADHDPAIDLESGLYGAGFIDGDTPNAVELFSRYVTLDLNCQKEPFGANICGTGLESGLESALTVLRRAANETRPAHRLREDALTAVIWLSDEEDQTFKDPPAGFDPWPPGPQRDMRLAEVLAEYQELGVLGCAIVGDTGTRAGGVCQPLGETDTVTGAQYGLGYIDVALGTDGFWASICNSNLQVTIDSCIRAAFNVAGSYVLQGRPLSATIQVAIDGELIPRSRTAGWDYDVVRNTLVLTGVRLSSSSVIALSYRTWTLSGG